MRKYPKEFKAAMCNLVQERAETKSISQALIEVATEAQISYSTLRNWFYPNSYKKYCANKSWNHSTPAEKSAPVKDTNYYRELISIKAQNSQESDF